MIKCNGKTRDKICTNKIQGLIDKYYVGGTRIQIASMPDDMIDVDGFCELIDINSALGRWMLGQLCKQE